MYATEIETDVTNRFIEIPEYEKFKGQHIKVLFMISDNEAKTKRENKNLKNLKNLTDFIKYRNENPIEVSKNINIDQLINEVNNDIF